MYWGDYQGRDTIADRLAGILDGFNATSHHISNIAPVIDGDQATCQSYVYAFHRRAETNEPFHYWGRWVDQLVKEDGAWCFAGREVVGIGSYDPGDAQRTGCTPVIRGRAWTRTRQA